MMLTAVDEYLNYRQGLQPFCYTRLRILFIQVSSRDRWTSKTTPYASWSREATEQSETK
jgi:cell division inhibitor SulA